MERYQIVPCGNKKRRIKNIGENLFLVEGPANFVKWSLKDPPDHVEFEGGPRLFVGDDFYGKGTIVEFSKNHNNDKKYKSIVVKVKKRDEDMGSVVFNRFLKRI